MLKPLVEIDGGQCSEEGGAFIWDWDNFDADDNAGKLEAVAELVEALDSDHDGDPEGVADKLRALASDLIKTYREAAKE